MLWATRMSGFSAISAVFAWLIAAKRTSRAREQLATEIWEPQAPDRLLGKQLKRDAPGVNLRGLANHP
jgi:hypothetical protein